jgi:predicted porin
MNKKIAAVAVAGLFAAPAVALAQSSVTISGTIKTSFENMKVGNYNAGVLPGGRAVSSGKDSSWGLADDSSRLIFNVREDLGGGLAAIVQLDMRVKPDDIQGAGPAVAGTIISGNSHVGLQSKSWGTVIFGRQDLHYFNTSFRGTAKGSLRSDSTSLLSFAGAYGVKGTAVTGGTAIANASRTQNVVRYLTPNWGGFTGIIAYSSSPTGADADIGNAATQSIRKGYAWNLNPNYAAANWQVGYSFWKSKPDAGMASNVGAAFLAGTVNGIATNFGGSDQTGHRLYGNYTFGFGLDIGLAWDSSKLKGNTNIADGATISKRTVWSIPLQYSFMGKHSLTGAYTWAKKDTADVADGLNTKANMWSLSYAYDLSKRTSLAVTYARINNSSNAGYQLFTSQSLGVATGGTMAGEDPRMFGTTIRHAF